MRERRRGLRDDEARDGGDVVGHLVQDENLVRAYLDVLVELVDDVYAAEPLGDVERLIFEAARDVVLRNAVEPRYLRRVLLLLQRVRLEGDRVEEGLLYHVGRELNQLGRNKVARPVLEGVTLDGRLPRERAEYEAAFVGEVVVPEEVLRVFEREVRALDEVLVEAEALRVDVVNPILIAAVYDEDYVRQRVGLVCEDARHAVELFARAERGQRALRVNLLLRRDRLRLRPRRVLPLRDRGRGRCREQRQKQEETEN